MANNFWKKAGQGLLAVGTGGLSLLADKSIRNGLGEAFLGTETKKKGAAALEEAKKTGGAVAKQSLDQLPGYDTAASESMGTSASDMMGKAQAASMTLADTMAQKNAEENAKSQIKAARTAGMNPGLAALMAGQGAGSTYNQAFAQGVNANMDRYGQNTQIIAGQGNQMSNRALQGGQLQAGIGGQQIDNANKTAAATWGGIGNIAKTVGGAITGGAL
jgi:hypothetical protein